MIVFPSQVEETTCRMSRFALGRLRTTAASSRVNPPGGVTSVVLNLGSDVTIQSAVALQVESTSMLYVGYTDQNSRNILGGVCDCGVLRYS